MSYRFYMAFATVADKAAAYDLCQKTVSTLCEPKNAVEHAIERFQFHRWYTFENQRPTDDVLNIWTNAIMNMRFVYWPKLNLLALVGEYPKAVQSLFKKQVYFQNSVDQNYELGMWDDDIPLFKEIKTAVLQMDARDAYMELYKWDPDANAFEDDPEQADYVAKSLIYKRIFEALDLDKWLYDHDGQFERICMSGMTSQDKILEVQLRVRVAVNKKYFLSDTDGEEDPEE